MRMISANFWTRFDLIEIPGQEIDFRQFITMQFKTGKWRIRVIARAEATELT